MEVTTFERILAIIIPVLIALVGTTLPAYFSNRKKKEDAKNLLANAGKTEAESDSIQVNSMQAVLEATNRLLIDPLKERLGELETENRALRIENGEIKEQLSTMETVHREELSKLEINNIEARREVSKLRNEMLQALLELEQCRKDLTIRVRALEKDKDE